MLLAVPSDAPGGLDAAISAHFGHCYAFTLIQVEDGQAGEVRILPNGGHEHGGCMTPVIFLKGEGVEALVAGGMGARPLAGFQEVGISVFFREDATTVAEAVSLFAAGACREFGAAQTCGGGGGGCDDHDHDHDHPIERPAIEGVADVCPGRVVSMHYLLTDAETGEELDTSAARGPLTYLHGFSQLIPGLESAMEGLVAGKKATITVAPADAYGERDDEKVFSVPRSQVGAQVEPGARVTAQTPQGRIVLEVVAVSEDEVTLDANHPMAGRTLRFQVEVLQVEAAAPEELSAQRVLA